MSRTYRIYNINTKFPKFDKYRKYNPFWWRHDKAEVRRQSNQDFRYREKQYFRKFKDHLIKCKDRGWRTW